MDSSVSRKANCKKEKMLLDSFTVILRMFSVTDLTNVVNKCSWRSVSIYGVKMFGFFNFFIIGF